MTGSPTKQITIYTDGACLGNPGPGGWAAIAMYGGKERTISGHAPATTNNRMELQAAIEGLKLLREPCNVTIYTDSKYVQQGMLEWVQGWQKRGWKTADKKPVKNVDLWQALLAASAPHKVRWQWVKGHADNLHNNRVDEAACAAARNPDAR